MFDSLVPMNIREHTARLTLLGSGIVILVAASFTGQTGDPVEYLIAQGFRNTVMQDAMAANGKRGTMGTAVTGT